MSVCIGVERLAKLVQTVQRVEHLQPGEGGARLGPPECLHLGPFLPVQVDIHTAFEVVPGLVDRGRGRSNVLGTPRVGQEVPILVELHAAAKIMLDQLNCTPGSP